MAFAPATEFAVYAQHRSRAWKTIVRGPLSLPGPTPSKPVGGESCTEPGFHRAIRNLFDGAEFPSLRRLISLSGSDAVDVNPLSYPPG